MEKQSYIQASGKNTVASERMEKTSMMKMMIAVSSIFGVVKETQDHGEDEIIASSIFTPWNGNHDDGDEDEKKKRKMMTTTTKNKKNDHEK